MSNTVDLAISASWIIPVVPAGRILEDCSLIIDNGVIVDILPRDTLSERYSILEHLELEGQALLPGLINGHGHAAMSLLRGYADDLELMTWLEQHIWPAETQWVNEAFVQDGSELAIAEMLLSGTTCFSDMYFFPEVTARIVRDAGMRAQIAFPILDFPTVWGTGPDDYFEKGLQLYDDYRSHDRIHIAFGPHAPYTVSDEPLRKIATFAEELQAPIQIHLHETAFEIHTSMSERGLRPSQRLADLGLLSPLTQCVHMTQVNDQDVNLLQQSGASVIHCPDSNLKLASGLCPINRLLDSGINVALGTDGAASNNDLNMLNECQSAALLAKLQSNNAAAVNAQTAIELATINGAKALGMEDSIGSLEIGKSADICAIDLTGMQHQPVYNALSQIIYGNTSNSVSNVWVGGQQLVKNARLHTMSEPPIIQKAKQWRDKISHAR